MIVTPNIYDIAHLSLIINKVVLFEEPEQQVVRHLLALVFEG